MRAILSVRPKCSHRRVSLKESPEELVLILEHATRISTERTFQNKMVSTHRDSNCSGASPIGGMKHGMERLQCVCAREAASELPVKPLDPTSMPIPTKAKGGVFIPPPAMKEVQFNQKGKGNQTRPPEPPGALRGAVLDPESHCLEAHSPTRASERLACPFLVPLPSLSGHARVRPLTQLLATRAEPKSSGPQVRQPWATQLATPWSQTML